MKQYRRAHLRRAVRTLLPAIVALAAASGALAQTTSSLVTTTHTVVGQGQPSAVEHDFKITNAGSYSVTLTDLGSKEPTPAPLASAAMAVTQGTSLVGTPVTAPGTAVTFSAAAGATYTIHVVGIPGTTLGSGPIEEDVSDSSGNKVFSSIDNLSTPSAPPNGFGVLTDAFTGTSGAYTLTMADFAFPTALTNPGLFLVDTTSGVEVATLTAFGSTPVTLNQGDTYQIIAFAQEGSGAAGGLFSVSIGASGSMAYGPKIVTVGAVSLLQTSVSGKPESSFSLGAGQATLSLTNLPFPTVPLASVGAVVVDATTAQAFPQNAAPPPGVTGTGAQNFIPPSASDTYQVYAYAVPDSTAQWGSYSVAVQQGTAFPFVEAQAAVSSASTIQPFTFDTTISSTGSYALTLTDFGVPSKLAQDALAVTQNGQLVNTINAAGNFTASLSQGPVTLLAFGNQGSTPGLMGIELSPAGGGAPLLDVTEGIGTGFSATSFTASSTGSVQANVADLGFPAKLANLDLAVTSGTTLVGSITSAGSSGSFPFSTTANTTYNVNVLATPAASSSSQPESAGTYAMSVDTPPAVTLNASSTTVTSGGTVTLTWTATDATSCTASASPSNSAWSGNESLSGGPVTTSAISATTTFTLSCTGPGGPGSASVTVTVSAASSSGKGGGGAFDLGTLFALAALGALRWRASRGGLISK